MNSTFVKLLWLLKLWKIYTIKGGGNFVNENEKLGENDELEDVKMV